jgi:hypothetical protein
MIGLPPCNTLYYSEQIRAAAPRKLYASRELKDQNSFVRNEQCPLDRGLENVRLWDSFLVFYLIGMYNIISLSFHVIFVYMILVEKGVVLSKLHCDLLNRFVV